MCTVYMSAHAECCQSFKLKPNTYSYIYSCVNLYWYFICLDNKSKGKKYRHIYSADNIPLGNINNSTNIVIIILT